MKRALRIRLPRADRTCDWYQVVGNFTFSNRAHSPKSRIAYAAVHVVTDPFAESGDGSVAQLDWEATIAYRRHVWQLGMGVAEAMDTAQRGMGLDWPIARELIHQVLQEARAVGGLVVCGAGTDHLEAGSARSLQEIEAAYDEQCAFVEGEGGQVVLMASRELARLARGPEDYLRVYGRVLSQLSRPAILHWLGPAFDPALRGYWGSDRFEEAAATCLELIKTHSEHVAGIKLSVLNDRHETELRQQLPAGVHLFTGDDFNYPSLIRGDGHRYSDALLGVFDAIAPAAAAALTELDQGNLEGYDRIMAATVPLSKHIFLHPTYNYKTGIVFLAYLNGHQSHFRMVGGLESARSPVHLAELFRLADGAGLLSDAELAVDRMKLIMNVAGFTQ